jgi:hypothetical protein
LFGSLAVGLALLRTIDPAEPNAFRVVIVQDFDGVAVEDGDDGAGEIGEGRVGANDQDK